MIAKICSIRWCEIMCEFFFLIRKIIKDERGSEGAKDLNDSNNRH